MPAPWMADATALAIHAFRALVLPEQPPVQLIVDGSSCVDEFARIEVMLLRDRQKLLTPPNVSVTLALAPGVPLLVTEIALPFGAVPAAVAVTTTVPLLQVEPPVGVWQAAV